MPQVMDPSSAPAPQQDSCAEMYLRLKTNYLNDTWNSVQKIAG